jgi:3-deoxy-7-phosphoheptulonate synthase
MIIELKKNITADKIEDLALQNRAFHIQNLDSDFLVTSASVKTLNDGLSAYAEKHWVFENDMQLSSRKFKNSTREIQLKEGLSIGGENKNTLLIGGPCSVESEAQIRSASELLQGLNLSVLRGGCYKPRTSPYSFQGMGLAGLELLSKMRDEFGHLIISEVRDATHVAEIIAHTDIIQIGAKAMYDQGILRACAKTQKPVMIKRGFGTTLQEFAQAAEFILSGGNSNVILCERGIRTFETKTRFTLDLCGVAWLQENTNLPIILDPSHAMGYAYGVASLTKACMAMSVEGLIIETHPDPSTAKSDAAQQLNFEEFKALHSELEPLAKCLGRNIK